MSIDWDSYKSQIRDSYVGEDGRGYQDLNDRERSAFDSILDSRIEARRKELEGDDGGEGTDPVSGRGSRGMGKGGGSDPGDGSDRYDREDRDDRYDGYGDADGPDYDAGEDMERSEGRHR